MNRLYESVGRVAIIATTLELLDAEERAADELALALDVQPPLSWPPEHNGPETRDWMRQVLARPGAEPAYTGWYVVGEGELVGTAGYKAPPDARGEVEIGYSIIPARQRRGYASGAVEILVARAFRDDRVRAVVAETLPANQPSQALLRHCGFEPAGTRVDAEDGEQVCFRRKR